MTFHLAGLTLFATLASLCATLAGCRTETTTADTAPAPPSAEISAAPSAQPAVPKLRRSGKPQDLSFDALEFEIEKDADFKREMLTPEIEALDGANIKLYGFILAASVYRQTGIEQFVLVRDNLECCFGPGAYIYHNIQVEMAEGRTADFSVRPVAVEGELRIRPWFGPDGKCYSVFHMTADRVE